jgi:hypothetical protein
MSLFAENESPAHMTALQQDSLGEHGNRSCDTGQARFKGRNAGRKVSGANPLRVASDTPYGSQTECQFRLQRVADHGLFA